jgi:hypothetical protein
MTGRSFARCLRNRLFLSGSSMRFITRPYECALRRALYWELSLRISSLTVGIWRSLRIPVCWSWVATDGQSAILSWCRAPIWNQIFFVLQLWASWCWAPSLTRGWICNILAQLSLVLARAITSGSKSCRTHDHILLPLLRLLQPGGPGPRIYVPQEQGGPVDTPS